MHIKAKVPGGASVIAPPGAQSRLLDRLVRPAVAVFGKRRSAFLLCACAGLALGTALVLALSAARGLSLVLALGLVALAVATFLGYAALTKVITGRETLVFYRHFVAVAVVASLLLWALGRPVLPYLEGLMLGVGLFQALGRAGCFLVGCCHGRPGRWGVCYRSAHASAGFPPHLVGVRLLPVQLLEMGGALAAVAAGSWCVARGGPPGSGLCAYVVLYGVGRFFLEFLRGDAERPYAGGFSEAQWVALLMLGAVVGAEVAGLLPVSVWHGLAAAGLLLAMLGTAWRRRAAGPRSLLFHPRHVREIARVLDQVCKAAPRGAAANVAPAVGRTSLGLQLSAGWMQQAARAGRHLSFSTPGRALNAKEAAALARLVLQLRREARPGELVQGGRGVFHLLVFSPGASEAA